MEGELLEACVVDEGVAIEMQEEIVFEEDALRLLVVTEVDLDREDEAAVASLRQLVRRLLDHWSTRHTQAGRYIPHQQQCFYFNSKVDYSYKPDFREEPHYYYYYYYYYLGCVSAASKWR